MINLQKFIAKEILIRLSADGFVSTVRYGGLYAKSSTWQTCCFEDTCSPVFVRPDEDDPGHQWLDDN